VSKDEEIREVCAELDGKMAELRATVAALREILETAGAGDGAGAVIP
jgi:hypothetical protein